MPDEHWAGEFQHASITDDNRGAFAENMAKFPTQADAVIGYSELSKSAGKPFKLPESMDKLPDDQSRTDLSAGMNKLIGRTIPKDLEAFADVNFKAGLPEGSPVNDKFVAMIKQFAVDKGVSLESIGDFTEFYNGPMTAFAKEASEAAELARMEACNEALAVKFGSKEKVSEQSELFRRAILNHPSVKGTDKAEEIADAMVKGGLSQNADLAEIMLKTFAPMAAETSAETNNNNTNTGDKPIDSDLGSPSQFATGLCTAAENEAWKARQVKA